MNVVAKIIPVAGVLLASVAQGQVDRTWEQPQRIDAGGAA